MLKNEILWTLFPFIISVGSLLFLLLIFTFVYSRRPSNPDVVKRMHKSFLGVFLRDFWYWIIDPIVSFFIFLRISPNMITILSLIIAFFAALYYYYGAFALAGWFVVISGSLDMIDGRLARRSNSETREGAFLDSCIDRYSDGIIFIGIALYFRNDIFMLLTSILVLLGSQLVSYVKARGETLDVITKRGIMQRPERIVFLSFISVFHPFFMIISRINGIKTDIPMIIGMSLMAILTNYTALVRFIEIFRKIRFQGHHDG